MFNQESLQIQHILHPLALKSGINLYMARADKVHHLASGNKIYKIRPHLEHVKNNDIKQLLSFGGAFSNHIHALALMAKQYNLDSIGIIRGEKEYANNPTLKDAMNAGMHLEFVSREEYKQRNNADYLNDLQKRFPDSLIIPEGGSSQLAISGCAQLAKDINTLQKSDILTVASGTGATMAGLVCGLANNQKAIAYAVLKDKSLTGRIEHFILKEGCENENYEIRKADFGGYAKLDNDVLSFILDWLEQTGILLDPVYTGKMCMRVMQQLEAGEFRSDTSITMIHSGGLQGWRGMQRRVKHLAGNRVWQRISDGLSL